MSRGKRAATAAETLEIIESGAYAAPSGARVDVAAAVRDCVDGTVLVTPADTASLEARAAEKRAARGYATTFEVRNETTFGAARRLADRFGEGRVAALNFASAKNPGGGFIGGSQAQEESLARASALYASLLKCPGYYEANRGCRSMLYTDHLIVSPRVPVFRDDADALLETPWRLTILTAPAPNAGAVAQNDPAEAPLIAPTFRRRIGQVLAAAVAFDQTALVLGAWGCGVFRNDPALVASLFAEHLTGGGRSAQAFEHVAFAVLDREGSTIAPFEATFGRA
jgi:uncharacterized protein (TIGR02452 family)